MASLVTLWTKRVRGPMPSSWAAKRWSFCCGRGSAWNWVALLAPHRAKRSCHISSSEYVDFVEQTSTSKGHGDRSVSRLLRNSWNNILANHYWWLITDCWYVSETWVTKQLLPDCRQLVKWLIVLWTFVWTRKYGTYNNHLNRMELSKTWISWEMPLCIKSDLTIPYEFLPHLGPITNIRNDAIGNWTLA